ncbi:MULTISPECIES: AAA family ATPase [unclassified Deinococcus]|uniref:AAA family ATPase n=1 Tax=unclassified Deinococcus TaxID=2623546 RepID=UPI001C311832|nr:MULTISPECIES: AAA family ATPase [unclassified Deinococcus]MDK2011877.1 AAA family ATPase [Deinococcus sp. 43]
MNTQITQTASHTSPSTQASRDDVRREVPAVTDLPAQGKFQPIRVNDLMQIAFPPQQFIVEGLIPVGLCMLAGAPKIGKSWATLDLALSVAAGRPFLGCATTQGSVLYLGLEDNQRRLQQRLRDMGQSLDWTGPRLELATAINAIDEGGLDDIEEWLRSAIKPRLIIIDVWGHFSSRRSSSKNEYDQITHALQPLQALAHQYNVTILLIHHTKKPSTENRGGDPFDQVLGSRALTSNMDVTMVLTRTRMQHGATLSMTGRDIEEKELAVRFDVQAYRWMTVDEVAEPALSGARQQVLDAVLAGHQATADIVRAVGKPRTAVANLLTALIRDGVLVRTSAGHYAPATAAEPGDMNDSGDTPTHEAFDDLV